MEYVNLYTRQHENSYYELKNKGEITNKEVYVRLHMGDIADFFTEKYRFFVREAEKRVRRSSEAEYPIWCSVSKNNCLKPVQKELVYCLRVPLEEVIYFDGTKWDHVLNNIYIPKDEDDAKRFKDKIKSLGVKDQFNFISGKYKGMFPDIEREIKESWTRIFDIDIWNEFSVQANLWRIDASWVVHIVKPGEDLFEIARDMDETFPPKFVV